MQPPKAPEIRAMARGGAATTRLLGLPSLGVFTESSLRLRCHQMDDFSPAKNLMTMCFTYYYVGKRRLHPWALLVLETGGEVCPVHGKGDGGVPKLALVWLTPIVSGKEPPWPRSCANLPETLAGVVAHADAGLSLLLARDVCMWQSPDVARPWACDVNAPAQKHLGSLLGVWWSLLHGGLDFLSKKGGRIKTYRNWDGIWAVSIWLLVSVVHLVAGSWQHPGPWGQLSS